MAVSQGDLAGGFGYAGCIYDNGVLLPSNMGYPGTVLAFSDANTLWTSDFSLRQGLVDSQGSTTLNDFRAFSGPFNLIGGNFYFNNGQVVSTQTGSLIGTLPVGGNGGRVGVNLAMQRAYTVIPSPGPIDGLQLSTYDMSTYRLLSTVGIPIGLVTVQHTTVLSNGSLAFRDDSKVYFVTP